MQYDGVSYAEDTASCDGSSSVIINGLTCSVPISTLKVSPFSLAWGASVYATITAVNSYGDSEVSTPGNGAEILTTPDVPIGLANVPAVTNAN